MIYSQSKDFINTIEFVINNVFNNNNAISHFSKAYGGSIYSFKSKGIFKNCSFNNNIATEYGGCSFLWDSDISFIECTFQNNSVNGYSVENGGAIFSSESILYLNKNSFINNTLATQDEFVIIDNINGAACYFNNSEVYVSDCEFVNNSIKVMNSNAYNICGGAIYSEKLTRLFKCTNCTFINNQIFNSNDKDGFGGAIYLNNGKLINCTFINNMAYNGCDINYDQIRDSNLCITGCIFEHNKIKNWIGNRSLIYINVIYNSLFINIFYNNRILNDNLFYLFDGKMKFKSNRIKFNFNNNCMYPFNNNSFTNGKFMIYNKFDENVSFNSAFNSVCNEYVVSETPLPTFDDQQVDSKKENIGCPQIL